MNERPDDRNDYLWDQSGARDVEVERLERLLGRYRHAGEPPAVDAPVSSARRARRGPWIALGALAAGLLAVVSLALLAREDAGAPGYTLTDGSREGFVRAGEELVAAEQARLVIGTLGEVEVERGSRLRVERAEADLHRLFLAQGTVRATIDAEPRVFQIGTPAGDAVDLGCAYELTVDDAGGARVRVTEGQVAFELDGREVYVPAGAGCVSTPDGGPRAPFFEDADPSFRAAVEAVERAADPDPALVAAAVRMEDRDDGLTVWHLFRSEAASDALRRAAYESLTRLFPMPQGVTEEGVLAGDEAMLAAWFERMSWSWR